MEGRKPHEKRRIWGGWGVVLPPDFFFESVRHGVKDQRRADD
jgi:hypothetical protein